MRIISCRNEIPCRWRILVTGVTAIHGWPVFQELQKALPEERLFGIRPPKMKIPSGAGIQSMCITDRDALARIKQVFRPTHVVHCSGVCDLDVCEERPAWARAINTHGTKAVADMFGDDCYILYLSTDLVFSGNNPPAGGYAEHHTADPVSVAGKTFAAAELELMRCRRCCIVRLGLPLGRSITGDKGALDWIRSRFEKRLPVTLFHDEWRSVIECRKIVRVILYLLSGEITGLFHCGGPVPASLHEVGKRVLEAGCFPGHLLRGISRHEEKNGPPRIGNVALDSSKLSALVAAE